MPNRADDATDASAAAAELATLRRENTVLRETLDALDATVVVYDQDRRYVMANRAYREYFPHLPAGGALTGLRYEDLLALSIDAGTVTDPMAYSDRDRFIARRIQAIEAHDETARETYVAATDRWYMIRVRHTPNGSRVALRVDITRQKRLQQELREAREAAEQANQAKSNFLARISHELRTPLNAVINFARLILDGIHGPVGAPEYGEFAHSIHDNGVHLAALIETLLDVARSDSGELTMSEQPVNLRALLTSVCRLHGAEAERVGVTIQTQVPASLPAIRGDGTLLRKVLDHLVAAAVAASPHGGLVAVDARLLETGAMELTLTDTGPGVAADDRPRQTRRVERAGRHAGTGLELPLIRHVIDLHGGTLVLERTPGTGTTARLRLPADRIVASDDGAP